MNQLGQTCFEASSREMVFRGGPERAEEKALVEERMAAVARVGSIPVPFLQCGVAVMAAEVRCATTQMCSRARVRRSMDDVPAAIVCKLSGKIMIDPVVTPSGHSYERREIEKELESNGGHDPLRVDKR